MSLAVSLSSLILVFIIWMKNASAGSQDFDWGKMYRSESFENEKLKLGNYYCTPDEKPIKLEQLNDILLKARIDYTSLTMSGLSSGASMTTQYHFAYSSEVKGIGMFAGVTYGTFYNQSGLPTENGFGVIKLLPALIVVPMGPTGNQVSILEAQARKFAKDGLIDTVANPKGSKVFIFQGTKDPLVNPKYGKENVDLYKRFGANVKASIDREIKHAVPTDNFPEPEPFFGSTNCGTTLGNSGVVNCGYQAIFEMFEHFYGNKYVKPTSSKKTATGNFYIFNQSGLTASGDTIKDFMDIQGFLYVPKYCQIKENTCKIHVALHGCGMNINNDILCNVWALKSGYRQIADANNVVMIFPQAAPIQLTLHTGFNMGCWDFFGGVSKDYAFKSGRHIRSIRRISRAVAKIDDEEMDE